MALLVFYKWIKMISNVILYFNHAQILANISTNLFSEIDRKFYIYVPGE